MPWAEIIIALIWIGCAVILLFVIAEIELKNRRITRPRWLRYLMIAFGPVTIVLALIAAFLEFVFQEMSVPDMITNVREALQKVRSDSSGSGDGSPDVVSSNRTFRKESQ